MTLSAGTKLGPYEIVGPLGAGGMGEVYRARDARLGRDVALKVLPESFATDADRLQRFEQEARAVAALSHPNILAIFDIGAERATHYLATELLEGATLREKLTAGALPARRAVDYAQQIAHGLAAAHEKGIVHRDLKPENLFVTRDGRIKILDFGLAKQDPLTLAQSAASSLATAAVHTAPGMVMGTVGYMAPEQVKGKPADSRSDIFAFGAVLYEMLSGRRAFQRDTSAETMTAILKEDPPELASGDHIVAPAFERIVRRCLEKDAEQRFQSAKDLAFALEAVTGSTSTVKAAAAVRIPRQVNAWMAAAIVLLAIVATAAVLLLFRPAPEPLFQYHRVTYARGTVFSARFAPDGETVVYTASWDGKEKDLYSVRKEYPDSRPLGIPGATTLLAISSTGELAVLVRDQYLMHMEHVGTLATAPLGGGAPREIAENVHAADYAPDGKSLAIARHLGDQETLEYPIGTVLYKIAGWFSNPRFSPDGRSIAFIEHPALGDDRGYVQLFDLASRKITRLTPEFESVQPLAWMPDGKHVLVSGTQASSNRHVLSVTPDGKMQDVLTLPMGANIFDVARDGRLLIATDTITATVIVYSVDGTEHELPYLDFPSGPILTRDGKNVVFSDDSEVAGNLYSVMVRKTDGSPPARLGVGNGVALSSDGKWVLAVVFSEPPKLMLLPVGAGEARELPRGNIAHYQFSGFFPDGKRIVFTGDEPGRPSRCYIQDIDGGPPRPITPEGYSVVFDPVAPDGKSFVARDPSGQLVVFLAEGGAPTPIANSSGADWPVGWSSDADHLFFYVQGSRDMTVYKLDVHTGNRTLVKRFVPRDAVGIVYSTWIGSMTPDGKTFAHAPRRELNDLYIADQPKQ